MSPRFFVLQIIENKPAVTAAPAAREYVQDYLHNAPVALCSIDPSAEQRSADTGKLVVDIWRAATRWPIKSAPSPRVSERVTALNAIFAANNSEGEPQILVDPRKCPMLAQALMGQYRWKLRKQGTGQQSVDGELDKQNRPFADVGDSLGYAVMGAGAHEGLIDFVRSNRPKRKARCIECGRETCVCRRSHFFR